jgi:hypothetical protein
LPSWKILLLLTDFFGVPHFSNSFRLLSLLKQRRDGMENLIKHGAVPILTKLTSVPGKTGLHALHALVNLSSVPTSASQCIEDAIDAGAISRATEIALSASFKDLKQDVTVADRTNAAVSLLANITRAERAAVELLGPSSFNEDESKIEENSKPMMSMLLSRFLSSGDDTRGCNFEDTHKQGLHDPYQHVAAILMNITQCESGRRFMMKLRSGKDDKHEKDVAATSYLQSILTQLRSPNKYRRRGVAGAIKNCCFEKDSAWWLLNELVILKHILYPLAGPEELDLDDKTGMDPELWLEGPDKVREPEVEVRVLLVEAVLLLCATGRISRNTIRTQKSFVILKMTDMVEESEEVGEKINECVQFLRRDEDGMEEGSSDKLVEEAWKADLMKSTSSNIPLLTYYGSGTEDVDYDNID